LGSEVIGNFLCGRALGPLGSRHTCRQDDLTSEGATVPGWPGLTGREVDGW
jgi:hypothetical protein